jgi:serine/threonine protein phosphatase 1
MERLDVAAKGLGVSAGAVEYDVLSPLIGVDLLSVGGRPPRGPSGRRLYAIGDIHGRLDLLDRLLAKIRQDIAAHGSRRPLFVFVGDYIDRGSHSRETIDRLIEHGRDVECVFLKGNHEQVAIRCLREPALFERWMRLGGLETLLSYGVTPSGVTPSPVAAAAAKQIVELQACFHAALPREHLEFFRHLKPSFMSGDFFFAHAGVKPRVALARQAENDLLWIRDEFLGADEDFGKIVVHGHTPNHEVDVRFNRINIDTGAFATGRLSCLVIDDATFSLIDTWDAG